MKYLHKEHSRLQSRIAKAEVQILTERSRAAALARELKKGPTHKLDIAFLDGKGRRVSPPGWRRLTTRKEDMRTAVFAMCALLYSAGSAAEGPADGHQYRFTQIIKENAAFTSGIIVDEKTGDMWEYINQAAIGNSPAVNGVIYLGRLRTGKEGEAIFGTMKKLSQPK